MELTTEDRDALRIQRVRDQIWRHLPVKTTVSVLPMTGMSVLDLAARTGSFSIALAQEGADVWAVEGREDNLGQWPTLPGQVSDRIARVQGDVRHLGGPLVAGETSNTSPQLRQFDVVLCLGILYHLERYDAERLLWNVFTRTKPGGIAIIDTHVGGHWQAEPGGMADPWGSIGNDRSYWFTPAELVALLLGRIDDGPEPVDLGKPALSASQSERFERVDVLSSKAYPDEPDSRMWVIAAKGGRA